MTYSLRKFFQLSLGLLAAIYLVACAGGGYAPSTSYDMKEGESGGYTYQYATNDPLNTRIYTLENGLQVYLSAYKATPRVYTSIAVRAGGKFDPPNHTGLAHYLEHMVFKGTSDFGTMDWDKEKVFLDSIEHMFEHYGTLTDPEERKAYYAQIDKVSGEAAKYAIPNEYDVLLSAMGARGTNAYTTYDRTVYINDIPSNQLNTWLEVEANRFQSLAPRLFHTELETVYEEKNRGLDSDSRTSYEKLLASMFPNHPYGTQTVIGTIEHLKNPSITEIKKYFNTYYRPNNVAICLSGDLDYDQTIAMVDKFFGSWAPNSDLPAWTSPKVSPPSQIMEQSVEGPEAEFVMLSYLAPGRGVPGHEKALLIDLLLSNSQAGLIDLNLRQAQKVLDASSFVFDNNDYSIQVLSANPREGQSLEEARDLLIEQINYIKEGAFDDWLLTAVVNDYKKRRITDYESNRARAAILVEVATNAGESLQERLELADAMGKVTKADIQAFAKEILTNYSVVYKRKGTREIPKVEKPQITKVTLNKGQRSPYSQEIMQREASEVQPVFLNYEEDIRHFTAKGGQLPVNYVRNEENDRFSLFYYSDLGEEVDPTISVAVRYLDYLAPEGMTAEDFQKELYKLGCEFSTGTNSERSYLQLSGLSENVEPALQLVERLLANPAPDEEALQKLIEGIQKERSNAMKNRNQIRSALYNYSLYGKRSPFSNKLSDQALTALTPEVLLEQLRRLLRTEHRVGYYGPMEEEQLTALLDNFHEVPDTFAPLPESEPFVMQAVSSPRVIWTHYNMVQSEILFTSRGERFDPAKMGPQALYNDIFGLGMSALTFRELREAQGLAYSTYAIFRSPTRAEQHDSYLAYVGTQADKQAEAIAAMLGLIREFPATEEGFEVARKGILARIRNERIIREDILYDYERARRRGLNEDVRRRVFEAAQTLSLEDIRTFQQSQIKDLNYVISVLGDKGRIDFPNLKQYGPVEEVSLGTLFGYETQEAPTP